MSWREFAERVSRLYDGEEADAWLRAWFEEDYDGCLVDEKLFVYGSFIQGALKQRAIEVDFREDVEWGDGKHSELEFYSAIVIKGETYRVCLGSARFIRGRSVENVEAFDRYTGQLLEYLTTRYHGLSER